MKIKIIAIVLCLCTVFILTGCKEAPETSIIKDKNFSKMIEDAQTPVDESGTSGNNQAVKPDGLVGKYETYKTTVTDETLGVTVNVDAKVNIPDIEKMSVLRVSQQKISQELIDKVVAEMFCGGQLCDGSKTKAETKADMESYINDIRNSLEDAEKIGDEERIEKCKNTLKELEAQYESLPDKIDLADYPHDGKLHSVSEEYNKNRYDNYYKWIYSLAPEGDVFYAVNDGKNGYYESIVAYNTSNYANSLMYTKAYNGYASAGLMESILNGKELVTQNDESATMNLSKDEAVAKAEETLKKLGIFGFELYSGDKYIDASYDQYINEYAGSLGTDGNSVRHSYYVLTYIRKIGGAFVLTGEDKLADVWQGNNYSKRIWPDEKIVFSVNDDGIVGFSYTAPIKITETIVDNSTIKSFEAIKGTFEKMMPITYASAKDKRVIDIDTVVFGYARISEKDSFDTGLLVPVWDFIGPSLYADKPDVPAKQTYMTINGIDGSIIDRQLGY